ncbi:glycosyltransferase family 2 protein [Nonlabens sp.]|uniref:glycosyltransferase family 2 protein n=1 Tax=Nonlabens sp. TaxID=1888209 RepID=UPI003F6A0E6A
MDEINLVEEIKLAIIIPYYKKTFFYDTLQSLSSQTNNNFNVYIGNDASLENPLGILQNFSNDLNIEYTVFESNKGSTSLVSQWHRCIQLSREEEWILILGDDDILENTVVQEFYNQYENFKNVSNVVRLSSSLINAKGQIISKRYSHPKLESPIDSYLRKFFYQTRSSLSEHIFSKRAFSKFGFFDYPLAWHSDDRAWLEFSNGKPIYSIDKSQVYIRLSSESISGTNMNYLKKNKSKFLFRKYVIDNYLEQLSKKQRLILFRNYELLLVHNEPINTIRWRNHFKFYFENFNLKYFSKFLFLFFKHGIVRFFKKNSQIRQNYHHEV